MFTTLSLDTNSSSTSRPVPRAHKRHRENDLTTSAHRQQQHSIEVGISSRLLRMADSWRAFRAKFAIWPSDSPTPHDADYIIARRPVDSISDPSAQR